MMKVQTTFPCSQKVALSNVTSEAKLIILGPLDYQFNNFVNTLSARNLFEGIFWFFKFQIPECEGSQNLGWAQNAAVDFEKSFEY